MIRFIFKKKKEKKKKKIYIFNKYLTVYSLSICFSDISLSEFNIFDNWNYMCLKGPYDGIWLYYLGLWKNEISVHPKGLDIKTGSTLRIGISSGDNAEGVEETVIAQLSQLNLWDSYKDFSFIRETSRGCSGSMGTVLPWSVVQFWLHETVTINSPSGCTSAGIYMPDKYM